MSDVPTRSERQLETIGPRLDDLERLMAKILERLNDGTGRAGRDEAAYLTTDEIADYLSVSPRWVRMQIRRGHLKVVRLGSRKNSPLRIPRENVDAFVRESNRQARRAGG